MGEDTHHVCVKIPDQYKRDEPSLNPIIDSNISHVYCLSIIYVSVQFMSNLPCWLLFNNITVKPGN